MTRSNPDNLILHCFSQFSFGGAVEKGGEQGNQLGGGLGVQTFERLQSWQFVRPKLVSCFALQGDFVDPPELIDRVGTGTLSISTWPACTWNQSSRRLRRASISS